MLHHAIATWLEAGVQFEEYADFGRDGTLRALRSPGMATLRRDVESPEPREKISD